MLILHRPQYIIRYPISSSPLGLRWFPSTARPHWDIHAWQDPHTEDLTDPDIPSSFVAEDS